jgi:hypothetical protein
VHSEHWDAAVEVDVDAASGELSQLTQRQEKRLFIKDMAYYLFAPDGEATEVAPSLRSGHWASSSNGASHANGTKDPAKAGNPTVLPIEVLQRYHFTFLIRHPRRSVPSFWRCTVPPLEQVTGFSPFSPSEAGYSELRRLFDYLKDANLIGPTRAGKGEPGRADEVAITVVDADDLLDNPDRVIRAFCNEVGVDYSPSMLQWGDEESQTLAKGLFGKWEGFHDDVLESQSLRPRSHHAVSCLLSWKNSSCTVHCALCAVHRGLVGRS